MPRNLAGYLPRVADVQLESRLEAMGAVVIEGVKSCGKTATARQFAASEVLLDAEIDAARALDVDPQIVLGGDTPRLLDEWQRAPRLWDLVRRAVDDRGELGQFILTGSATPLDEVPRHSGAGRIATLRMRTMTLVEQQVAMPTVSLSGLLKGDVLASTHCKLVFRDYVHHIAVGGWPQLVGAAESTSRVFLDGYIDAIIEHDIDEVSGATRNPRLVRRFLHAYAQLTAHTATLSTIIARTRDDAQPPDGPSRYAAQPYLDALRRMMIVDEIPAWDPSVRSSKRLVNTPKRMLGDPSLAVALLGVSSERLLSDLTTLGFLFEGLVAHDLRVYAEAANASCFHYREHDGRLEVDYVIEDRNGEWIGVEVKLGNSQIDLAAQSLKRLAARVPRDPKALVVVTSGSYGYLREDGVYVVPLGCLGP